MNRESFEALPFISKQEALMLKKYLLSFVDEKCDFIQEAISTETYFSITDYKMEYIFNISNVYFDKSSKKNFLFNRLQTKKSI